MLSPYRVGHVPKLTYQSWLTRLVTRCTVSRPRSPIGFHSSKSLQMIRSLRKPTNCKCGNFRDAGHHWVVIQRRDNPASSHLKCLDCGWKWWKSARFVSKLPDHVERSRSGLSDQDILARINSGSLFVHVERAEVFGFSRGWKQLRAISRTSNGSTYRFVEVSYQGKKKKIALHRLVWMFAHMQVVPDGFDVDHVNGKRGDFPDRIGNLQLLESRVNRSQGCPSESLQLFEEEAF